MSEVGAHLANGLPWLVAAIVLFVAARWLCGATTCFKADPGLLQEENSAIGVVFGAYLFAVAIALVGTRFGWGQQGMLVVAVHEYRG
jgi:hypothetical protein